MQIMEGRYLNVTSEDYHNGSLRHVLGSSGLKKFRISPAHYQAFLNEPGKESKEMNFGTAYHYRLLQSGEYLKRVVLGLDRQKRSKADREAWAEFEKRHEGKTIITKEENTVLDRMFDSIMKHPTARTILETEGNYEDTYIWDSEHGFLCKCRVDKSIVRADHGYIVELKTSRNARSGPFGRDIALYGYDISAAWYLAGVQRILKIPFMFFFLVQEKEPPFAVNVFEADQEMTDSARNKIFPLIERFGKCLENDLWPSYPDGIHNIRMPGYAYKWEVEDTLF